MKYFFPFFLLASLCAAQVNNARMLSGTNPQTGTSYNFQPADSTRVTTFSNSSPVAVCLSSVLGLCSGVPAGTGAQFGAGYVFAVVNRGAGQVTITCQSCTINGAGTLALAQNQGVDIYGDAAGADIAVQSPSGANFALLSGANSFTGPNSFVSVNNVQYADQFPGADAGAKIAAAIAALPSTGGIVDARGFGSIQQTISSQLAIGTSTKIVTLIVSPETYYAVNVTGGVCAIPIGDGSAITTGAESTLWTVNVPLTQKAMFALSATANVSAVICAANPSSQQTIYLNGVAVWGNATATVGTALYDIQGLAAGTKIENSASGNCYATALEIRPSPSNNITSDLLFENDNFACGGTAGSTIAVIDSVSNAKLIANINFINVQFQNQGSAQSLLTTNGHGASGGGVGILGLRFYGCDFEVSSSSADAIVLTDTRDVTLDFVESSGTVGTATNLVRLAETVGGITYNIEIRHLAGYSSGGASFTNLLTDVSGNSYNGTTVSGVKSITNFCFRCNSISPIAYTGAGVLVLGTHAVFGSCTLGTNCSITLTNSAVYTSASSYVCTAADQTAANAVRVNQTSGSAFAITGTGTDVIGYSCLGN